MPLLKKIDHYLYRADDWIGRAGPYVFVAILVAVALVYGDDIIAAFRY